MAKSRGKWSGQHLVLEDEPTVYSAASTALKNYGVTVLTTKGVYKIEAPSSGCHTKIIATNTTKVIKVVAGESAKFNSTDTTYSVECASAYLGCQINLYGASTALWYGAVTRSTDDTVTLTTAT